MSKYLDTGKVQVPTNINQIDSKIISDDLKKELIKDL